MDEEIKIEGHVFCRRYNEELWLWGPDGDGMEISGETLEKLKKLIADFFKENM